MRNKIRDILIRLANWIGDRGYYDFGEPIKYTQTWKDGLVVATSTKLFFSDDGRTWKEINKAHK
jgi:hypothetical protein